MYTVNPAYDKFNDLISFVREGDLRARGCAQGPDEVEHIFSENSLHIQTERERERDTHTRNGKSIVIIKIKVEKLMRKNRNEIGRSIKQFR